MDPEALGNRDDLPLHNSSLHQVEAGPSNTADGRNPEFATEAPVFALASTQDNTAETKKKGAEGKPVAVRDIRDLMICNEGSKTPKAILHNLLVVLRNDPLFVGVLAYDEFSRSVVTKKLTPWQQIPGSTWTDVDDTQFANWLQHSYMLANSKQVPEAVELAARDNVFHPVRAYLNGLTWDGGRRIDYWLCRYMGAEDKPINRAFGSKWLISAVARVFKPGCQVDHTLLLEGPQGMRKSTALRTLASGDWFTDHISDLRDKDARIELQGKWIIEFSELHAIKGKALEIVKSFLTTQVDHFRPPWGRRSTANPRQCVFTSRLFC